MKLIFFFMSLFLLVTACGTETITEDKEGSILLEPDQDKNIVEVAPPITEVTPPSSKDDIPEEMPSPKTSVATTSSSPSQDASTPIFQGKARDVLSKADLKVKSFSYVYREPPYNQGSDRYVVMGDKIRIILGEDNLNLVTGVSDIFLNTKTKQAAGYCFKRDSFLCRETADVKFSLKYADFYKPTSYDWMKRIVEAQYLGSEQIEGKNAISLAVRLHDQPDNWAGVKFFIDDFYGLPIKVVIETEQGKTLTYNFDKHDVNSYTEADVTPPQGY